MTQLNSNSCGIRRQHNGSCCKNVCIFRVPDPILVNKDNKEAYVPSVVSFGPYHIGSGKTLIMYEHKHEAAKRMARRIQQTENYLLAEVQKMEEEIKRQYEVLFVAEVQKMEEEIKEHYKEATETDGDGQPFSLFSIMMTKDACFILEFLKCSANPRDPDDNICFSRIFQTRGCKNSMHNAILTDIMKLENQVPLCVLITLLQLECENSRDNAIKELAALLSNSDLFKQGFPFYGDDVSSNKENENSVSSKALKTHIKKGARHLLDLYRMVIRDRLIPEKGKEPSDCVQITCSPHDSKNSQGESLIPPCAKSFENAGIEFKRGKMRFEKSKFGNSKLVLPQITVKYRTEVLLRNLMAYEECQRCSFNSDQETVISDYVCLLDRLIDSEKDVAVLRDSQVIRSFVGSDKVVVDMFNKLMIGITIEPPDLDAKNIFDEEMRKATQHYNSKWKVLLSEFQQAHFSKPWYVVSLFAAIALLVMTVIQTVYTVK